LPPAWQIREGGDRTTEPVYTPVRNKYNECMADTERTVPRHLLRSVSAHPDRTALRWKLGDGWATWTWAELAAQVGRAAAGLRALGVRRGDRVVLMERNRPEFHVADHAALLLGATPISIYNSSAPEQIEYLAGHARASVAIVDDLAFLERLLKVRSELAYLRHTIVIDDPDGLAPADVHRWHEVLDTAPLAIDDEAANARPDDLATVIYTSGTTGPPKGVMLDHENIVWTIDSFRQAAGIDLDGFRVVSYLPMAHIAERTVSHYLATTCAFEVTTCPDPGKVVPYLVATRPQLFFAVPRVWEKAHAALHAAPDPQPAMIGLDECAIAVTGAAPIPRETLQFFRDIGVPLSEVYGLSETTGPMTWTPFAVKVGSVGPALPGVEVRLDTDGEVCCRGGNVFRGYLDAPDKTADVLDADGWFHSGDIGVLDDDGYLTIVDRKKELIITAGGKNVSPANLEAALKAGQLIGQACAIGEARPYVSALLVLDADVVPGWAARRGIEAQTLAELARHPEVLAEVKREVQEANARFSRAEQIRRWTVLAEEWLPDSEELTPTMKLKRRGVHAKYAAEIDALYR